MEDTSSDHAESDYKRARPDSTEEEEEEQKRRRVDELPEGKIIEDDLLNILEDSDDSSDGDPVIHDLDFVIKSFEEEIIVPGKHPSLIVLDPTQKDAPIELGYLLEASDDDLGLPPRFANSADESSNHEVPELPDISSSAPFLTPFDGEMPNYDHFDLGPDINNDNMIGNEEFVIATPFDGEMFNYDHFDLGPEIINNNNNLVGKEGNDEFVMLGGLFDFQENWDVPEVMWRPESLPAV